MIEFNDLDYNDRTKNGLVLVDVKTEWCGPCKALAPLLEELSTEYIGKVIFGKVDADKCPEISKNLNIRSVPTLILYKNGVLIERYTGVSSKVKIKLMVDKHLN